MARNARISGPVRLKVVVAGDGTVEDVRYISGHVLLAKAAMDAVRQWVYKPTLLNGQPVAVVTEVEVNFTLGDQ
jgi:periplasmic protein TonB